MSHVADPMGLNGFEFVEFAGPRPALMAETFEKLGFVAAAIHPERDIVRYRQGRINLLLNREKQGHAARFAAIHGASACGMAFRVADAAQAFRRALELGAEAADASAGALGRDSHVLKGIGGANLYLVDRHGAAGDLYGDWSAVPGAAEAERRNSVGLDLLDHLTHNVRRGHMGAWADFYARVFGFREQKHFDIEGRATGLVSQAMIAPDGQIRIPLNESKDDRSQIEEFLRDYNGEGIQHLALTTHDIHATVEKLRARGVELQDTIETYYDLIDKRLPGHGEDLARLRRNRILIDGAPGAGLLLQIFTGNLFGPIFFEIIQRKGDEGFGEGNFKALFESLELDQIRRGVVKIDA